MVKGHPSSAEKLECDDKVLRDPAECEKEGKKGRNKGKEILMEDKGMCAQICTVDMSMKTPGLL